MESLAMVSVHFKRRARLPDSCTLVKQFYRIELGEQRRLQGIMDFHTQEFAKSQEYSSARTDGRAVFPDAVNEVRFRAHSVCSSADA